MRRARWTVQLLAMAWIVGAGSIAACGGEEDVDWEIEAASSALAPPDCPGCPTCNPRYGCRPEYEESSDECADPEETGCSAEEKQSE
jgi:hypothetical protein